MEVHLVNDINNNKNINQAHDVSAEYKQISEEDKEEENLPDKNLQKLWVVSAICLVFMIVEVIGGYLANSLAIMSDAAHMFSDLLGFMISIVSIIIAKRSATNKMTYGYHRAEVIGALVSVTLIWGLTIWLISEATQRFITPSPVDGKIMLIVAILGLIFNLIMGVVLAYEGIDHGMHSHSHGEDGDHGHEHSKKDTVTDSEYHAEDKKSLMKDYKGDVKIELKEDHGHSHEEKKDDHGHAHSHGEERNINIDAALIHVIGDAVQNIGVIISGAIIYFRPELMWIDPLCTVIFAVIVFFTTTRILKDCVAVIMEGSPIDNPEKMKVRLLRIEGVSEVHDLHVWSISKGKVSMTCHLKSSTPQISLLKATELMAKKYNITHTTIQVEDSNHDNNICKQNLH
jgi:zinc transporter 2